MPPPSLEYKNSDVKIESYYITFNYLVMSNTVNVETWRFFNFKDCVDQIVRINVYLNHNFISTTFVTVNRLTTPSFSLLKYRQQTSGLLSTIISSHNHGNSNENVDGVHVDSNRSEKIELIHGEFL